MANHKSAEKRARQSIKKTERNRKIRSTVRTAVKTAQTAGPDTQAKALSAAFSEIQKAKGVLHPNTVKRKMGRLAKALARKATPASS